MKVYLDRQGQRMGPYSVDEINQFLVTGQVLITDMAWHGGLDEWVPLDQVPGVQNVALPPSTPHPLWNSPSSAPPTAQAHVQMVAPVQVVQVVASKSRTAYVLLGLFLGGLGIHNFYAGYAGRGVAQLLITLFGGWMCFPWIAVMVWVLVEVCSVTQDAQGNQFS